MGRAEGLVTLPRIIPLWPDGSRQNPSDPSQRPRIEVYSPQNDHGGLMPGVIVFPGGGYEMRAQHEGAPVARLFADHGLIGIVCHYRVAPHHFPAPLADALRAVRLVRHMGEDLGIDRQRVGLMGFSAGGHLASTVATQPQLHREPDDDLLDRYKARPERLMLAYPVISMVGEHHQASAENLLGPSPSIERRRQMSNELHVTPQNPPTFLFHTFDDGVVPASNSLRFSQALLDQGVSVELHLYNSGPHGVGLGGIWPKLQSWPVLLVDWLSSWTVPLI